MHALRPRETYQPVADEHATTTGGLYADPKSIEHETAAGTGEEYALVAKPRSKNQTSTDVVSIPLLWIYLSLHVHLTYTLD